MYDFRNKTTGLLKRYISVIGDVINLSNAGKLDEFKSEAEKIKTYTEFDNNNNNNFDLGTMLLVQSLDSLAKHLKAEWSNASNLPEKQYCENTMVYIKHIVLNKSLPRDWYAPW